MRNILLIGNGFDLYHGLRTRYIDFLELIKNWMYFKPRYEALLTGTCLIDFPICDNDYSSELERLLADSKKYNLKNIREFDDIILSNSWIKFFLQSSSIIYGWIDFENEIETVLRLFSLAFEAYNEKERDRNILDAAQSNLSESDIRSLCSFDHYFSRARATGLHTVIYVNDPYYDKRFEKLNTEKILDDLKTELNGLIRCLEIYFLEFVETVAVDKRSGQINRIKINNVINFNYTNTCKLYAIPLENIHFVHGHIGNTPNNLVLGIKDDDQRLDFIYFKKYFQRIQKHTGNDYKYWLLPKINEIFAKEKNIIYIFGHSLDKTDGDILSEVITSENTQKVIIYYLNQTVYEKQVINLIDIFGRDMIVDMISNSKIEFELIE